MRNNSINHFDHAVLYSSTFTELIHIPQEDMIIATWKENSKKLVEQGVIDEISRLLEYIGIYTVRNVIVDVRHYAFTDNRKIQLWINSFYVPKLMESSVVKYAFVVKEVPPGGSQDLDEELKPCVGYFRSHDEAACWMNKGCKDENN